MHLGMSSADVNELLGAPDYSPIAGQYYHYTGEGCWLRENSDVPSAADRRVPCGYVIDYHQYEPRSDRLTDTVQRCWWGAIGE
jgi:hypothetical protein